MHVMFTKTALQTSLNSFVSLKNTTFDPANLKCYYQKVTFFFPSDFESVIAERLTGKILSFDFYPKAVYFESKTE